MWLVDSNYIFECDWLIELSDNKLSNNKLSDNNLASELVENRTFLKPITSEEIEIFMIIRHKLLEDYKVSIESCFKVTLEFPYRKKQYVQLNHLAWIYIR